MTLRKSMADRPRCQSCKHPLDQPKVKLVNRAGVSSMGYYAAGWSRCDEQCDHGGTFRLQDGGIAAGGSVAARGRHPVEAECPKCDGRGKFATASTNPNPSMFAIGLPGAGYVTCQRCGGTGRVQMCAVCAQTINVSSQTPTR
jgi:hypothetical protein